MEDNTDLGRLTYSAMQNLRTVFDLTKTSDYNRAYGIVRDWFAGGNQLIDAEMLMTLLVRNGFKLKAGRGHLRPETKQRLPPHSKTQWGRNFFKGKK